MLIDLENRDLNNADLKAPGEGDAVLHVRNFSVQGIVSATDAV